MTRAGRLLFVYPRAWRERYGQELLSMIEAGSDGGHVPWRIRLDVVRAGLSQRLRSSGLLSDDLPPEMRVKASLLLVLSSWSAFVIAGVGLQKTSEHWQAVTPHPKDALPAAAFASVVVAAAIGSAAVLFGIVLAARPLITFLRAGGWRQIRRTVIRAVCFSVLTAIVLVAVSSWAERLTSVQRNGDDWLYGVAFLLLAVGVVGSISAWTLAAVTTARHLAVSRTTLKLQTFLAATATLTMATMTGATTVWWISVAGVAPTFFGAGVPWKMVAVSLTMLASSSFAIVGTLRSFHTARPKDSRTGG